LKRWILIIALTRMEHNGVVKLEKKPTSVMIRNRRRDISLWISGCARLGERLRRAEGVVLWW